MSLLSQDSREQLYTFTDKDSSGRRLQSRTVLLRGAPSIMTTQVIDETDKLSSITAISVYIVAL